MGYSCFKNFNKFHLIILFCFIIISSVKICLSFIFPGPWIFADEGIYDEIARNIYLTKSLTQFALTQIYPPGYSVFLSVAYAFSPDKTVIYHSMLAMNALVTSSIIFPAFFILKKYTNEFFSLSGALIIATLPSVNLYSFTLMSENLFIPLTAFSLWFILQSFENESPCWDFLAGFSIFYLFFTRSTGIAMIAGLFFAMVYYLCTQPGNRTIFQKIRTKFFLIISFSIPVLLWLFIKRTFPRASLIGYDTTRYTDNFFSLALNVNNFPEAISLITNEVGFLILATYCILFFSAAFFCICTFFPKIPATAKIHEFKDMPQNVRLGLKTAMVYFIFLSVAHIGITITHMYYRLSIGDNYYHIFGRYLDPIVPLIFILGFILIYYIQNSDQVRKSFSLIIIALTGFTLVIFNYILPVTQYKFPNMLSIFYIQPVQKILPLWEFYLLFFVIVVILVAFIQNRKIYILFIMCLLLMSVFIMYPSYCNELSVSRNTEDVNQIGRYLQQHSDVNTIILMDRQDYNSYWGPNMWFLSEFWSQAKFTRTSSPKDPSGVNSTIAKQSDYIISTKLLPYPVLSESTLGYKLYRVKNDNRTVFSGNHPPIIDIGLNDDYYVENFYPAENNQFRWSKNSSGILIEYPKKCGEMNLSVQIGGSRPSSNPANVRFSINDHSLGNITSAENLTVISYTVQDIYLNDQYSILKIETNTWNPTDYGSTDDRDLGVIVDWVSVQSNNLNKADKYCNSSSPTI